MKKLLTYIIIAAFALTSLTGCAGGNTQTAVNPPEPTPRSTEARNTQPEGSPTGSTLTPAPGQGITVNKIKFEKVDPAALAQDKKDIIENLKSNKGFTYWRDDAYFYIAIFGGKKSTAGYNVNVLTIEDNEGRTNILVDEAEPTGAAATVISYPFIVIRATGITDNFNIANAKGESYSLLQGPVSALPESGENVIGTLNGRIDNNAVEIDIPSIGAHAFMIYDVQDVFNQLKDGEKVKFSYKTNESKQLIITKAVKA